jgi:hypothetical protein
VVGVPASCRPQDAEKGNPTLRRGVEAVPIYQTARLWVAKHNNIQITKAFRYIPSIHLLTVVHKTEAIKPTYQNQNKSPLKPQKLNMMSLKKRESIFGIILDKVGCSNRWIKKIT